MSVIKLKNYINGQFVECTSELDSVNPATGEVLLKVPDSSAKEIDAAVEAAKTAFKTWRKLTTQKRANVILKVADILESRLDEFAEAESSDQGKPVWLARSVDIPRAVLNFRHFAHTFPHMLNTSKMLPQANTVAYTTRDPIGVSGLISPWNLPLYLLTFKIAPALMAGNTVVAKPSELTSLTAFMLCKVFQDAGVPAGVLNMVFGRGPTAGAALVQHPDVPLISFTGSTATGKYIASATAPLFKKLSLEMGGKNSAIVYPDCNRENTLETLMRSSFINQGQVCLCTSRIFVHQDIFDEFVEQFVQKARSKKVGDPQDSSVFLGALNSFEHLQKVKGCVHLAIKEGGQVLCGETVDELTLPEHLGKGFFMAPTVITGMPDSASCMAEEIFGPVVCMTPFTADEEVIGRANGVRYGLCASVFTSNLEKAHKLADSLQVGTVWINSWLVRDLDLPFGGIKDSGMGFEGTNESWEFFTHPKAICVKLS